MYQNYIQPYTEEFDTQMEGADKLTPTQFAKRVVFKCIENEENGFLDESIWHIRNEYGLPKVKEKAIKKAFRKIICKMFSESHPNEDDQPRAG